ncbi:MAG: redox-sensing transcriptional repressor Rex [Armatimonadetes bacterium]|nr:redox-sensing transcriptional repressor Rex [Armatimonadota bacterium]
MNRLENNHQVPLPALERLASYMRCLMQLEQEGVRTVSSLEMEALTGISAAQFRKDLSHFGEFGKRGIGYDVGKLQDQIAELLRIQKEQPVLLVGAGNLGRALIAFPGWRAYGFRIVAVFDKDPRKIGTQICRIRVRPFEELATTNRQLGARIGIITVPPGEAQPVADCLVAAGVVGIINFAPVKLRLPRSVTVREVCFISELAVLSYLIHTREGPLPPADVSGDGHGVEACEGTTAG